MSDTANFMNKVVQVTSETHECLDVPLTGNSNYFISNDHWNYFLQKDYTIPTLTKLSFTFLLIYVI